MSVTLYGVPGTNYVPLGSGTSYTADSNGLINNVPDSAKEDLIRQGCIDAIIWGELQLASAGQRVRSLGAVTVYTIMPSDAGRILVSTAATELTLNVPFGLPLGFSCDAVQYDAGDVLPVAAVGVNIWNSQSYVKTAAQYSLLFLRGIAQDVYILSFPNGDGSI